MIDEDSCMNIISNSAIKKMDLITEPYYLVDKSFYYIIQLCLVPIIVIVFGMTSYT